MHKNTTRKTKQTKINSGSLDLQPVREKSLRRMKVDLEGVCSNSSLQHFSFRYQHNPINLSVFREMVVCLFELAGR